MAEEMALTAGQVRDLSTQMKTLAERTKAFDKNVDELTASLRVLDGVQKDLLKRSSNLEKAANRADKAVEQAKKSYEAFRTQTGQGALDAAVQEQERLHRELEVLLTILEPEGAAKPRQTVADTRKGFSEGKAISQQKSVSATASCS